MAEGNVIRHWASCEMQAVLDGNQQVLQSLLKEGQHVDDIPCIPSTYTLLHIAVGLNHQDIVKLLLKEGANPNRRSRSGLTPLHISVVWDHSEILLCLLEYGGIPSLVDNEGNDAFFMAKQHNSNKCMEILQKYKPDKQRQLTKENAKINETYILDTNSPKQEIVLFCKQSSAITKPKCNTDDDELAQELEKYCNISPKVQLQDLVKLSNNDVRKCLIAMGDSPGPVVNSTRNLYLKRLAKFKSKQDIMMNLHLPGYPSEISLILENKLNFLKLVSLEKEMREDFENQQHDTKWREGTQKSSFIYLLIDSRITRDLPSRIPNLSFREIFQTFVLAIFYIGKGTQARPYSHLHEALNNQNAGDLQQVPKIREILDIWASGHGVISLHCYHNLIPVEAYTREACIIEVLGVSNLTNQRRGNYYGQASNWTADKKRKFGAYLLYRAMLIFLNEGERELYPADLQP